MAEQSTRCPIESRWARAEKLSLVRRKIAKLGAKPHTPTTLQLCRDLFWLNSSRILQETYPNLRPSLHR